jgi:hypothetical protein
MTNLTHTTPTSPTTVSITKIRALFDGRVIAPGDPGCDDARKVSYGGTDRRPAAVVRAKDATDVSRVVCVPEQPGRQLRDLQDEDRRQESRQPHQRPGRGLQPRLAAAREAVMEESRSWRRDDAPSAIEESGAQGEQSKVYKNEGTERPIRARMYPARAAFSGETRRLAGSGLASEEQGIGGRQANLKRRKT